MGNPNILYFYLGLLALFGAVWVQAEDPYLYYTWTVTYGTISPLGKPQGGILINGQFPGPNIQSVTNDNIVLNLINKLDEPILITWNGIKQRRTSWQDGVLGTNCPIPPNGNWTYKFQTKDQIGTFSYFISTAMHRTIGGFGGVNVMQRSVIAVPYPIPDGEFTVLAGDWYGDDHKVLQQKLDEGAGPLAYPKFVLINGRSIGTVFTGEKGHCYRHFVKDRKSYKFRVSNVGTAYSLNFRIQGHRMTLVEVEGAHTVQEVYDSLDVHPGQSIAVLVTLNNSPSDYVVVASTRFERVAHNATAVLRYLGSKGPSPLPLPIGPTHHVHWSMKQARTIRLNLTANAARPNPQGSFHYGNITIVRSLVLSNTQTKINGKLRYAVNGKSYVDQPTPLKIADWFNIPGVFTLNSIPERPSSTPAVLGTSVVSTTLHDFVHIVFQNPENTTQSWHLDGYSGYVVGYGGGEWSQDKMRSPYYNLVDAVPRHTVQVYRRAWTAMLVSLDNKGMWNLRSAIWYRRYLGQQLYIRVGNDEKSVYTETDIPSNVLFCGKAKHP